jgi:hypothetical protein
MNPLRDLPVDQPRKGVGIDDARRVERRDERSEAAGQRGVRNSGIPSLR